MNIFYAQNIEWVKERIRGKSLPGVYILEISPKIVKVGQTGKLTKRINNFESQYDIKKSQLGFIPSYYPVPLETFILKGLQQKFEFTGREWFKASFNDILWEIEKMSFESDAPS